MDNKDMTIARIIKEKMEIENDSYKKKLGTKLKNYLNADETNTFTYLKLTALEIRRIIEIFGNNGNLTKEEHENIKKTLTYLKKFVFLMEKRLSEKSISNVNKRIGSGYYVKFIDKYTEKRLKLDTYKDLEVVKIPRTEFDEWCDEIMNTKCKGCTINHCDCKLHDVFFNNFIPESSWELQNCRYAIPKEKGYGRYSKEEILKCDEIINKEGNK